MSEMREKLAEKAFEQALLYLKIEKYKAATNAFRFVMQKYPDSKYREEAQFMYFSSAVALAGASTAKKQESRYLDAMDYYQKFTDKYPNSEFLKQAESIYVKARKDLVKIEEARKENEAKKSASNS